jgi:AcrR family transcriptional regulator
MQSLIIACQEENVTIGNKFLHSFFLWYITSQMKKNTPKKPSPKKSKLSPKTADNQSDAIPYGRDAVKKAILEAAEKLLMERYPSEISVREIAKAAQVKHPLIYRHFGTKDELIATVHHQNIDRTKQAIGKVENIEGNIETFFRAVEVNKFRQIALARAMIEGVDPRLLQDQFPVMQYFLELIKKKQNESDSEPKFDAGMIAATVSATALGWILYEPFLLAATGLEDENIDEIKKTVAAILEEFIKVSC